jgi:hypothetical protein
MMRHPVADYDAWRRAYDAFGDERRTLGATGDAVWQSLDDARDVTVSMDFATAHAARAFADSARVRAWMEEAGVAVPPEMWLVSER